MLKKAITILPFDINTVITVFESIIPLCHTKNAKVCVNHTLKAYEENCYIKTILLLKTI